MPKRKRRPKKLIQISKAEKQDFDRFGCTFRERTGVFYIDWRGKDVAQAAKAEIFARLVWVKTESGPIVLLACEISPVRPLPRYCYFPFDLRKQVHRRYLSRFAEAGEIRFCFLTDKKTFDLTHQLTPHLRLRTSEIYAEVSQEWGTYKRDQFDFDAALELLERHVRIPLYLERVLLQDTLSELTVKTKEVIQTVPIVNLELARRIVGEAAEAFEPYYQSNGKALFEGLYRIRMGLACIIDLRQLFAANPIGLTEFIVDGLAGTFSQKELEGLNQLLKLVLSLTKLPFREQVKEPVSSSIEASATIPDFPVGFVAHIQSMVTSGIPKDSTTRFFELIGLEVGGKPGRPTKDYSLEYDLKASGLTWTQVARSALLQNTEIREEFRGRDFDSLDWRQKEALKNRIREGVRSYAERAGKSFPISASADAEGEEKNQ